MQIEIWSDFVCPFCYIGKKRLEQAIERFPKKLNISIRYKSYELDPNATNYAGKNMNETLAEKYNMTIEKAEQMNKQIADQARTVGLEFVFDTMKPGNTFHAHRVSKYAKKINQEAKYVDTMLYNYFTLSKDISNPDTILSITDDLGFDHKEVKEILENKDTFASEVRNDQDEAKELGITGVPFFVINNKYAISGAQPIETFMQALEKVADEENINIQQGSFCEGDNCK